MSIASNHEFPRHSHDEFGIGVIRTGSHRSWSGVGQVTAKAGDVIMVNPGEVHDGGPIDNRPREWEMIYLDAKRIATEFQCELQNFNEVARPVVQDQILVSRFDRFFKLLSSGNAESLEIEEKMLDLVMHIARTHGRKRTPLEHFPVSVTKALNLINHAPEMQVTLSSLAALCGCSRFQTLRAFKKAIGITPHAYILQKRVLVAKAKLAQGIEPVEAAMTSGFADQSHLTRAFVGKSDVLLGGINLLSWVDLQFRSRLRNLPVRILSYE